MKELIGNFSYYLSLTLLSLFLIGCFSLFIAASLISRENFHKKYEEQFKSRSILKEIRK